MSTWSPRPDKNWVKERFCSSAELTGSSRSTRLYLASAAETTIASGTTNRKGKGDRRTSGSTSHRGQGQVTSQRLDHERTGLLTSASLDRTATTGSSSVAFERHWEARAMQNLFIPHYETVGFCSGSTWLSGNYISQDPLRCAVLGLSWTGEPCT